MDYKSTVEKLGLSQPWEPPHWQGWDHQLLARHEAIKSRRFILSMDKGTGKTSTVLSIFEGPEIQKPPGFTVLIFTTEKGMGAYVRDIEKFPNHKGKVALIYGNKAQRTKAWQAAGKNSATRYFVCTYAGFLSDSGLRGDGEKGTLSTAILPKWVVDDSVDAVVCDEFHRVFRNRTSKIFGLFKRLFKSTRYFIPMSGSAVDRGPQDLWPALHLVDQKFWSSYWNYVGAFCEVEESGFGKRIIGPRNEAAWRRIVRPYMFHVTADQVHDMPPIFRDALDVTLPKWQKDIHDNLRAAMFHEFHEFNMDDDNEDGGGGGFIFAQNTMVKTYKSRLALICPKVFSPSFGYGQAIEDVADNAEEGGLSSYAMFTPFKDPIPHLKEYLESRGGKVWVLQGGIGLAVQEQRLAEWRASLHTASVQCPSIIISTIKYGESWEIPETRHAYMLGYEFSREDNKQAESRLRRLISVGTTFIHYVKCRHTYDDELLSRLIEHGQNFERLFRSWAEVKKILGGNYD